jgi:hypothetical protein
VQSTAVLSRGRFGDFVNENEACQASQGSADMKVEEEEGIVCEEVRLG